MNVSFGGTLWQRIHEVPGHSDHREDESLPLEKQYGPAHEVLLEPGGLFRKIAGRDRLEVNSLHSQGIQTLGKGLTVEARAPDGIVEACATVRYLDRVRTVAFRLEGTDGRWRCTVLQFG